MRKYIILASVVEAIVVLAVGYCVWTVQSIKTDNAEIKAWQIKAESVVDTQGNYIKALLEGVRKIQGDVDALIQGGKG